MCRTTLPVVAVTGITHFSSRVLRCYAAMSSHKSMGRSRCPKHFFPIFSWGRISTWSRGQRSFAPDASTVSRHVLWYRTFRLRCDPRPGRLPRRNAGLYARLRSRSREANRTSRMVSGAHESVPSWFRRRASTSHLRALVDRPASDIRSSNARHQARARRGACRLRWVSQPRCPSLRRVPRYVGRDATADTTVSYDTRKEC
jgi:hypothetical protein